MKKKNLFVAMMMVMTMCAAASNGWLTTASECITPSWPVAKSSAEPKFPQTSWLLTEEESSWPVC